MSLTPLNTVCSALLFQARRRVKAVWRLLSPPLRWCERLAACCSAVDDAKRAASIPVVGGSPAGSPLGCESDLLVPSLCNEKTQGEENRSSCLPGTQCQFSWNLLADARLQGARHDSQTRNVFRSKIMRPRQTTCSRISVLPPFFPLGKQRMRI